MFLAGKAKGIAMEVSASHGVIRRIRSEKGCCEGQMSGFDKDKMRDTSECANRHFEEPASGDCGIGDFGIYTTNGDNGIIGATSLLFAWQSVNRSS